MGSGVNKLVLQMLIALDPGRRMFSKPYILNPPEISLVSLGHQHGKHLFE